MPLNNEIIQTPLPGDLQQRVENALNLITFSEAELARLTKLASDEKDKINTQHITKKGLESDIKALNREKLSLDTQIKSKNESLVQIEYKISDAKNGLVELQRQKDELNKAIADQNVIIMNESARLKEVQDDIMARAQQLAKNEASHQAKVEKLKAALY